MIDLYLICPLCIDGFNARLQYLQYISKADAVLH